MAWHLASSIIKYHFLHTTLYSSYQLYATGSADIHMLITASFTLTHKPVDRETNKKRSETLPDATQTAGYLAGICVSVLWIQPYSKQICYQVAFCHRVLFQSRNGNQFPLLTVQCHNFQYDLTSRTLAFCPPSVVCDSASS